MTNPVLGGGASLTKQVTADMLAASMGSGSLGVLATPAVAALMEGAAVKLAQCFLENGETTVGTSISIRHLCPTAENMTVTAEARLTSVPTASVKVTFI